MRFFKKVITAIKNLGKRIVNAFRRTKAPTEKEIKIDVEPKVQKEIKIKKPIISEKEYQEKSRENKNSLYYQLKILAENYMMGEPQSEALDTLKVEVDELLTKIEAEVYTSWSEIGDIWYRIKREYEDMRGF